MVEFSKVWMGKMQVSIDLKTLESAGSHSSACAICEAWRRPRLLRRQGIHRRGDRRALWCSHCRRRALLVVSVSAYQAWWHHGWRCSLRHARHMWRRWYAAWHALCLLITTTTCRRCCRSIRRLPRIPLPRNMSLTMLLALKRSCRGSMDKLSNVGVLEGDVGEVRNVKK